MKKWILVAVALHMGVMPGFGEERRAEDIARDILLCCRCPEDPLPDEDLASFAMGMGLSDEDVSEMLVRFVDGGLHGGGDALERQLTGASLWALVRFGGEKESLIVRQLMRETEDDGLRQTAVRVGMRLAPDHWEEWLREAVADKRFGNRDRWMVYEEVFRIGHDGDEKTRQRVIEVLAEMRARDSYRVNQNRLGGWIAELKGGDAWEVWLREVLTGEGFYPANREHAFNLAMQAGRNGDARTRQRVIEVFGKLCNDESLDVDRNALRQWIGELEKMP